MTKLEKKVVTEQHSAKEVDINQIVKKAKRTGLFPQRTDRPRYGDFVGVTDFHEAQNRLIEAGEDFMKLPSHVRERFKNDPGELLQFINDPDNLEEAQTLGLVPKQESMGTKQPVEPKVHQALPEGSEQKAENPPKTE